MRGTLSKLNDTTYDVSLFTQYPLQCLPWEGEKAYQTWLLLAKLQVFNEHSLHHHQIKVHVIKNNQRFLNQYVVWLA